MLRIRRFEETVEQLFLAGELPGFVHLCIGQEATAAGACAALDAADYITSTHRGHGHTLAKGATMARMMAELFGKATGVCQGRGGSMHIADFGVGMLGANGIVAGGLSLAVGAAMSIRLLGGSQVALAFFGDGAANRGPFHESLNWAAVYRLPVIFLCEHNQYASTTDARRLTAVEDIAERAAAYRMSAAVVDGNDVEAVYAATSTAVARARSGEGPSLVECKTYRLRGHYVGDPTTYRDRTELERWRAHDPIGLLEARLLQADPAAAEIIARTQLEVEAELADAVAFAQSSPLPEPATALDYAFTD
jgi:pyruvate dehydrogenase E1 component alpha subunit